MSAKRRHSHQGRSPDPSDLVTEYGRRLAEAADPLEAEALAAAMIGLPGTEELAAGMAEVFVTGLIDVAGKHPSPESAALLRAIAAVAPPHQRRQAVAALGEVTSAGHYPPEWAAQIGRAVPRAAWRRHDVFGDADTVAVTFSYGEAEHGIILHIDRCREPTVLTAMVVTDVAQLHAYLAEPDPLIRTEPIALAEARARLEPALVREPATITDSRLADAARLSLPIARARLRRLPTGEVPAPRRYDAADRSAAVAEFLASPEAAEAVAAVAGDGAGAGAGAGAGDVDGAGDEKTVRFWAEVLTGYSAGVTGEPPARVGPLKLTEILLSYVPATFALTAGQRHGLPAAVTAWTRWAAIGQELDEPARAQLAEHLPELFARFEESYDATDVTLVRSYLADVSATTTDAMALADALTRRTVAVPAPEDRAEERTRSLDAADPAHRRTVLESEFGDCMPPKGMNHEEFLATVVAVGEQLWHDDPPDRWRQARALVDSGVDHHDVIHQLVARTGRRVQ